MKAQSTDTADDDDYEPFPFNNAADDDYDPFPITDGDEGEEPGNEEEPVIEKKRMHKGNASKPLVVHDSDSEEEAVTSIKRPEEEPTATTKDKKKKKDKKKADTDESAPKKPAKYTIASVFEQYKHNGESLAYSNKSLVKAVMVVAAFKECILEKQILAANKRNGYWSLVFNFQNSTLKSNKKGRRVSAQLCHL